MPTMPDQLWDDDWDNRFNKLHKEISCESRTVPIDTVVARLGELRSEAVDHGVDEDFLIRVFSRICG